MTILRRDWATLAISVGLPAGHLALRLAMRRTGLPRHRPDEAYIATLRRWWRARDDAGARHRF